MTSPLRATSSVAFLAGMVLAFPAAPASAAHPEPIIIGPWPGLGYCHPIYFYDFGFCHPPIRTPTSTAVEVETPDGPVQGNSPVLAKATVSLVQPEDVAPSGVAVLELRGPAEACPPRADLLLPVATGALVPDPDAPGSASAQGDLSGAFPDGVAAPGRYWAVARFSGRDGLASSESACVPAFEVSAPTAELSATDLTFNDGAPQPVGTIGRTTVVELTNVGGGTLDLEPVALAEDDFLITSSPCARALTADQVCTVKLRFTPQEVGERLASLAFSVGGDVRRVQLRGVGGPAATGPAGPAGAGGPAGATGASGPEGPTGSTGATGSDGRAGATGATGAPGVTGATGPVGEAGKDGANGSDGKEGASGSVLGTTASSGDKAVLAILQSADTALECDAARGLCRVALKLPRGRHFLDARILSSEGVRHRGVSLSTRGVILNRKGRELSLGRGRHTIIVRLRRGTRTLARTYRLDVR